MQHGAGHVQPEVGQPKVGQLKAGQPLVAHIIDSLQVGGAQKLLVTMAEVLYKHGDALSVMSLDDRQSPIQDQLQALDVPVFNCGGRNKLFDPGRVLRIARYLRQKRFDVVHTHLTHANILGTVAGRLAGAPVVASLHNTQLDRRQHSPFKEFLEITALRFGAQRVIAVGHVVEEAYRPYFGDKPIAIVPNAVSPISALSPAARTAIRAALVGDPARPLLIAVGRLTPQKGYPDLLAAVDVLRRTYPAVALIIAGEGRLESEVQQQIGSMGLTDHVFLLGRRDDVPDLLAASDVYVSASLWEGLSVATLEAMAAGLPVVATQVGEVPRMVVAGAGTIVAPQDPEALAQALASFLESPAKRQLVGATAKAHVARYYDANTWVQQLLALYRGLYTPAPPILSQEHV